MKENHLRTCRRPGWFFFSLMLSLNVDELSDNLTTQPINKQKRAQCPDHSKVFPLRDIICFTQEALG